MQAGEVVGGRFEIEALAGSGGMANVFRALDRSSGRRVALKVLSGRPQAVDVARFTREAVLLSELSHPGIVGYVAHGASSLGESYLAMEWLDGEPLSERLKRGAFSVADSIAIGSKIADALSMAHGKGVIHRDIKPANIFLVDGKVARLKVVDFGIALLTESVQRVTQGRVVGTPAYMAPENARGKVDLDARADLFSLGCVLYECLTGSRAFGGEQGLSVALKVMLEEPPPIRGRQPDVPEDLAMLVKRLLAKDREKRPDSAAAVTRILSTVGTQTEAPPLYSAEPRPSITQQEQTILGVLLVTTGDPESGQPISSIGLDGERLSQLGLRHGGRPVWVSPETMAIVWRGGGDQTAADLAAYAARCALAAESALRGVSFALATGRGIWSGQSPVGEALDRAVSQLSRPGPGIPIDEVTASLLPTRFDVLVEGEGFFRLRNEHLHSDPMRKLVGVETPCVGRRKELALLRTTWEECIEEPVAQAVLLEGEAGMGKSRLRYELIRQLRASGIPMHLWVGRGDPMRSGAPFSLLGHALRSAIGLTDGSTRTLWHRMLTQWVEARVPGDGAERVASFLGEILGLQTPDADHPALAAAREDPSLMRSLLEQAFVDIVTSEVAKYPLILVLEDLHWGDLPSLTIIGSALTRLPSKPWMVLGISRLEIAESLIEPLATFGMQRLRVDRLRPQAGMELVRHVLGANASDEVVRRLVDQTEGHAFFLEEVIRAHAGGQGPKTIPPTVLAMSQSRLEALSLEERMVLRAASILGQSFQAEGVTLLVQRPLSEVERLLESLERQELLTARAAGPAKEYGFRHNLLRDAAYAMLTEEDLRLGHRLAGEWLEDTGVEEPVLLAEHYGKAGLPERAIPHLHRAASRAFEGHDLDGAMHLCERSVAAGATGETLGEIRLLEAEVELWRGNYRLVGRKAREAMDLLPEDSGNWAMACATRTVGAIRIGQFEEARMVGEALWESTQDAPRTERWMHGIARAAGEFAHANLWDDAHRLSAQLIQWEREGVEPSMGTKATWLNMQASEILMAGDYEGYLTNRREAQALWQQGGDVRRAAGAYGQIGYALNVLGQDEEALECFELCLAKAPGPHNRLGAKHNLGLTLARLGRAAEGLEHEREAIAGFRAMGAKQMEAGSRFYASRIALLGGDALAAEQYARDAVAFSREQGLSLHLSALGALASALAAQGRYSDAQGAVNEVLAALEEGAHVDESGLYLLLTCADVLRGLGDRERSQATMQTAFEELLDRARKITNAELRASFLRVSEHARILRLAEQWCGLTYKQG